MTATPEQYLHTFELTSDGQAVFDDLAQVFGGPVFDPNPYEMARRAGRREVLEHIQAQITAAERKS